MIKVPKQGPVLFDGGDAFLLILITITSVWTRFWLINHPGDVCFDEVYFGNFTNYYLKGQYFYDIHPPFGKLVMALMAKIGDYNANITFEGRGLITYKNVDYITLRMTPALFGALCAPLIYLSVRFTSFSKTAAFIAAVAMIADSSILTEQRFILSDGMLHFWSMLFFTVFAYTASLRVTTVRWYVMTFISGLLLGACASCKNTAWGLMLYSAYIEIFIICQEHERISVDMYRDIMQRGSFLLLPVIIVFFGSFAVHYALLPYDGPGVDYMRYDIKKQFIFENRTNSQLRAKRLRSPILMYKIIELFIDMFVGNMGITQFHPSQSQPYNWPFLSGRWVDFWNGHGTEIHCAGNPVVYYLTSTSIILSLLCRKKRKFDLLMRFVVAWAVSYFPFFLIPRSMYLYHYIIPLMIACMNLGALIDTYFTDDVRYGKFWKGFIATIIIFLLVVSFYMYSPYSYGTKHIDSRYLDWRKEWRAGDAYFRSVSALPRTD
jgi:dolichyl-phosphate-mannose--protein O-mannosyl transferase